MAVALMGLIAPVHASDVVTLTCDFPEQHGLHAHYDKMVADQRGISVTSYSKNGEGKLEYVKNYTENKKDDSSESYYRINSVEIAWGTTYYLMKMKFDSSIDLRSGLARDDSMSLAKGESRPTEVGNCRPD